MTVLLDGESIGTVRRKQRLSVQVPDGPHQLTARIGSTTSRPLTVEVDEAGAIVAIRVVVPADRRQQTPRQDYLQLVQVAGFDDRGSSYRELHSSRPPIGYRRLRSGERVLYAIAFVVLIIGQTLRHTLGSGPSLILSGPAAIVLLVLIVRLFLYRPDR